MAFKNSRTRYEGELIKVLNGELGDEWFGQRGTHSYGVDVLMFKSTSNSIVAQTLLFEVKSLVEWPFYVSGRNKSQYEGYLELLETKNVEVVYAVRTVGRGAEKWRFAPITAFSVTNRGNPCLKMDDTVGLLTFVHTIEAI
jgi:Holliday junction resolvase